MTLLMVPLNFKTALGSKSNRAMLKVATQKKKKKEISAHVYTYGVLKKKNKF